MSSSTGNSGAAIADGTPPRKVSDERDRSHQPAAAAGSSSSSSSSSSFSVTGGVAGAAAASSAAAAAASSGGGGGADGGVEDDDAVDSTDVEEYEMSKVDRDVREILHVEQSHIAHVGLMENLRQFYLAHNPRILQSPNFLRDLVSVFEGREKQLFEKLEQTYQTNDPMPAFVYSGGGRLGGHSIAGGRAPVSFLKNITMEGLLFRKPTLKGMRGKVQEIMQPHEGWFELCGSLLVWSQSPKTKPRGKLRLLPRTVAEAIGDRNFRIKTAGKILLMCQAKDKETRDEWVRKLQTTLEYLAMEAKQAQLLGQSSGGAARHSEAAAAAAAMEAAAAETSRITDAESDDDDEDPRSGGGGGRHRTARRQSRLADVDDTSSDDDAPTSGGGGALPQVQPQAVQPSGVMHVAVTSALAADPATDEAVDGFRRGTRSSLQVAKRKILSASGVVAVTALAMQYYGLVPVLVSAVVGLLCIYGRFFDVTDAPPEAAGTVVLTAVPGAAAVFAPSTTAAAGTVAVGAPAASASVAKARGSSSSSRSRRKSVQSGQRSNRGSSSKRSSTSSKGSARGGGGGDGGGGDDQANSDDEAFEDCVNESMTAPSSAGDGGGGGGSKSHKSAAAGAVAATTTGTRPGVVPPLHLYGELGVRFLPSEAGIVPRGLSFKLNDDFHPVDFETPFFRGRMVLRIKDAIGAAPTQYFDGRRRLFSIQVEGRFKQRLRTDRVLFGSSFKHKISMPRGASVAMSILRGIDPALRDDLFADENPWIMSPLICAVERLQARLPDPNDTEFNGLGPWRYGGGEAIEEDSSLTLPEEKRAKLGDKKMSFGQRRKYFADVKKRQVTFWEPGLVYTFDFLSARMDFNTYKVKMAKFIEFGTTKLMNKQPFQLEARVMDEADPNKKIGAMWAFEFCHNKVAPFAPEMEVIDHSNDL